MNNIATINTSQHHFVVTSETKRKRLKVLSACNECRRKKTKCNGEAPCASCIKSHVNCLYSTKNNNHVSTLKKMANTSKPPIKDESHQSPQQHQQQHQQHTAVNNYRLIQSIESRLNSIEDILHQLLRRQQQQYDTMMTTPRKKPHSVAQNSNSSSNSVYYYQPKSEHSTTIKRKRKYEDLPLILPPILSESIQRTSIENYSDSSLPSSSHYRPSAFFRLYPSNNRVVAGSPSSY